MTRQEKTRQDKTTTRQDKTRNMQCGHDEGPRTHGIFLCKRAHERKTTRPHNTSLHDLWLFCNDPCQLGEAYWTHEYRNSILLALYTEKFCTSLWASLVSPTSLRHQRSSQRRAEFLCVKSKIHRIAIIMGPTKNKHNTSKHWEQIVLLAVLTQLRQDSARVDSPRLGNNLISMLRVRCTTRSCRDIMLITSRFKRCQYLHVLGVQFL